MSNGMGRTAVKKPRNASKQQTREALVAAALELFAEEGLDAPSLDAICERAGYTRGAFYVHFPDRDALLVAVMEKVGERFLASVFEHVAEDKRPRSEPPASILAQAAQRFIAAIDAGRYPLMAAQTPSKKRHPQVRPHQLLDACARSSIVRERYKALVEASIEHVAHLGRLDQAAGLLQPELDARQIGTLLLGAVIGAQTMAELGVAIDPGALARTVMRMLSRS
jgi:TetR/AcrR family transcriptional regulator, transcriptional repressor for nem operon